MRQTLEHLFQVELDLDRNVVLVTIVSTLLLLINAYHRFSPWIALDRAGLFLLVPLGFVIFVFRERPGDYGFQLGDWRAGLALTATAILLVSPVLWLVVRLEPSMRSFYGWQSNPALPLSTFLDLIGWEFLFRGILLFAYARKFGEYALWLQAVPFALVHLPKPELETLSTIFGGFLFGLVAWRTRSFLYPFLIHWFVMTFTILAAAGVLGV